jgi:membrane-associated phospholipid phosphatase
MPLTELVTAFGNAAVLLPLALTLTVWIAAAVSVRAAAGWLACVAGVTTLTALAKIWFAGCHYQVLQIHSPSGHTSFSVITYGGLSVALAAGIAGVQRWLILAAGIGWALAIGVSRVILRAHTVEEVVAGLCIGGTGVAVFAAYYRSPRRPGLIAMGAMSAICLSLALIPAVHVSLESDWSWLGRWLAQRVAMCV